MILRGGCGMLRQPQNPHRTSPMKTTRSLLLSLLMLGPAAVPLPAQLLFDFDAAGDLAGFSERGVSGGNQFSVNTTLTGIGGASGVLLASQNVDETIVYTGLGGTTTWAATPSITTSIFFQYLGTFPSATLVYAQIGLMSSANSSFNTGNNNGGDGANNDYASGGCVTRTGLRSDSNSRGRAWSATRIPRTTTTLRPGFP